MCVWSGKLIFLCNVWKHSSTKLESNFNSIWFLNRSPAIQNTVQRAQSLFGRSLTDLEPQPCVHFSLRSNTIKLNCPAVPDRVDLDWRRWTLWGLHCGLYSFVLPPSFWTWLMVWVMKGHSTHTMTLTQSLHESVHQSLWVKPHSCFWHTLSVAVFQHALRDFRLAIIAGTNANWWR